MTHSTRVAIQGHRLQVLRQHREQSDVIRAADLSYIDLVLVHLLVRLRKSRGRRGRTLLLPVKRLLAAGRPGLGRSWRLRIRHVQAAIRIEVWLRRMLLCISTAAFAALGRHT